MSAAPTVFENDIYRARVMAGVSRPRVAAVEGEFQRGILSIEVAIWCKAMDEVYGEDHNRPEIFVSANALPQTMAAAIRFLEKLDIATFVPETAAFHTMDFALDWIAFSARAAGMPADQVDEIRDEITVTEDRENKTKIPGLPYNQPMRPDLFFNGIRDQLIEDVKKQLEGLID